DDYLRAEVVYAASHEGARHLDDVLARRTRSSIEAFHRGTDVAAASAELMAGAVGGSEQQQSRQVEHHLAREDDDRESQAMPDDETADAARMGACGVVPVSR